MQSKNKNPLKDKFVVVYDGRTSTSEIMRGLLGSEPDIRWILSRDYRTLDTYPLTPIFLRCAEPSLMMEIEILIRLGIPYIYYIDDNFWLLDDDSALGNYYRHPSVRKALTYFVRNASLVISNTEKFKAFLHTFNINSIKLDPHFDFEHIQNVAATENTKPSEFRVGIVSSISRIEDFENISQDILKVINNTPDNLVFEIIGTTPKSLTEIKRVRGFPAINDYPSFLRFQASRRWSIALAPLRDSEFSLYKTNNKYREYGGCGIAGIYSKSAIYTESVTDGVNGFIVDSEKPWSWYEAIMYAYHNQDIVEQVGRNARKQVYEKHSLHNIKDSWHNALLKIPTRRGSLLKKIIGRKIACDLRKEAKQPPAVITDNSTHHACRSIVGTSVFLVNPMQSIETITNYQTVKRIKYILMVATFGQTPTGKIKITASDTQNRDSLGSLIIDAFKDNQTINFEIFPNSSNPVSICVMNYSDKPIALYKLDDRGETIFLESSTKHPGSFAI